MKTKYFLIIVAVAAILVILRMAYNSQQTQGFVGGSGGAVDTFSMYYADWCPHCQTIKPVFKDYSKSGSTIVASKTVFLQMVEADTSPEKLKGKPVKGYPTFLLEKSDGTFVEFDGDRSPSGWNEWLAKNL